MTDRVRAFSLGVCTALLSLLPPDRVAGQLLSRDSYPLWKRERYENYGSFGYRRFRKEDVERRVYDPFGVYLIDGVNVFELQEARTEGPERGSLISKSQIYTRIFRNLVIGTDSYKGWSASLMAGDAIPTRFSPLTLNLSRLNGVRWDASSRKARFSVIGSRISAPVLVGPQGDPLLVGDEGVGLSRTPEIAAFGTYLFGGHWETTLGSVLTLGSTYVNVHNFDSAAGRQAGSIRGVIPFSSLEEGKSVLVVVSDDSPGDGRGPRIYRMEIYIDGQKRDDVQPDIRLIPSVPDFLAATRRETALGASEIALQRADRPSWLIESFRLEEIIKEKYGRDGKLSAFGNGGLFFMGGKPVTHEGGAFLEANGTDVLVYRYEIPPGSQEVLFKALAAGDYCVDVASALIWKDTDVQWRDWHTVKRAEGNPRDRSNMGWIAFRYGFPTGMNLYGINLEAKLFGFRAWGEYTQNTSYFKFPSALGKRLLTRTDAYFFNIFRGMEYADLGFEFANLPSAFTSSFPALMQNSRQSSVEPFELVEDNDDRDEWPDRWEQTPEFSSLNLTPAPGIGLGYGIFPGLDMDRDGVPDNLWYTGADRILTYYEEPFVFGDDFNNNGIVDERENDNRTDYPYDRDTRGGHFFVTLRPRPAQKDIWVRAGRYDMRQPGGGGRNLTSYVKANYLRRRPGVGRLEVNYYGKRVQDDIRNDLYQPIGSAYEVFADRLLLRNSLQHILVFSTRVDTSAVSNFNVYNDIRLEINDQREVADEDFYQPEARITALDYVFRMDYTWRLGESFALTPMFKAAVNRTRAELFSLRRHTYTLTPMVRGDYQLAPHTVVRGGLLGVPFREIHRDLIRPFLDRESWYYVLALENLSPYKGYNVSTSLGYQRDFDRYRSSHRPSIGRVRYFILVRIG